MLGTLFSGIAQLHNLTRASGMAYGLLNGCFVTLSEEPGVQRISIYVGGQMQPAPGYQESSTVSCARQIMQTISTASGAENVYSLLVGNEKIPSLVLNHAGSVVTVNFSDAPEAHAGIERFIDELLPGIARLTLPRQCICCCQMTNGDAVPVRLSADTVAPMHAPCCQQVAGGRAPASAERRQQLTAVLAAMSGAVVGGILWALLCRLSPWTWAVGVLMGLLPVVAYDFLRGKPGRARIATAVICAMAAALLGTLGAEWMGAHSEYLRNITIMHSRGIGEWDYILGSFRSDYGIGKDLYPLLVAGALTAGLGCLLLLRRPAKAATVAAEAVKPRRLKGQF